MVKLFGNSKDVEESHVAPAKRLKLKVLEKRTVRLSLPTLRIIILFDSCSCFFFLFTTFSTTRDTNNFTFCRAIALSLSPKMTKLAHHNSTFFLAWAMVFGGCFFFFLLIVLVSSRGFRTATSHTDQNWETRWYVSYTIVGKVLEKFRSYKFFGKSLPSRTFVITFFYFLHDIL